MENAVDALQMAFAVLVFVLALSISIFYFGQARETAQFVVNTRDRETEYAYVDYKETDTNRIVGEETIIPSLYRAIKEHYVVRFEGIDDFYEFKKEGIFEKQKEIDFLTIVTGNPNDARKFLDNLLGSPNNINKEFSNLRNLPSVDFYAIIKNNKFKETLGIYQMEDVGDTSSTIPDANIPDSNKTDKRVITYTKVDK